MAPRGWVVETIPFRAMTGDRRESNFILSLIFKNAGFENIPSVAQMSKLRRGSEGLVNINHQRPVRRQRDAGRITGF